MRNNMTDAYLTVEATILIPIAILCFVLLTYMCVFVYDRTLIYQDAYTMAIYAREEYFTNAKKYTDRMDDKFAIIEKEHPYLSLDDFSMSLTQKGNGISISASGEFRTPFGYVSGLLFEPKDRSMLTKAEVNLYDPVKNMLITKDLVEK